MARPAGRVEKFPKCGGVSRVESGCVRKIMGWVGSGRVRNFSKSQWSGRVGLGQVGSGRVGSGEVGSGGFKSHGSGWVTVILPDPAHEM